MECVCVCLCVVCMYVCMRSHVEESVKAFCPPPQHHIPAITYIQNSKQLPP